MPSLEFAGLITAYVAIAVLLLSLNLFSRWSWWTKILTNLVVVGFFWVSYHSYPQLLGWPTKHGLPERFYLYAVNVDEPDTIYLWGGDLDRGLEHVVPRAYQLPYSKSLHQRANLAARKLRKGLPMIGEVSVGMSAGKQDGDFVQASATEVDVNFVDAPQSMVPRKRQE